MIFLVFGRVGFPFVFENLARLHVFFGFGNFEMLLGEAIGGIISNVILSKQNRPNCEGSRSVNEHESCHLKVPKYLL